MMYIHVYLLYAHSLMNIQCTLYLSVGIFKSKANINSVHLSRILYRI